MVKPHVVPKAASPQAETSTLMSDSEFDNFWAGLYARRPPHFPPERPEPLKTVDTREEAAHRGRSSKPTPQRCGACRGCAANDCGNCKNCRDKPRFGGPGIKKKACLKRVCYKLRDADDDDDDDDDDELPPPTQPMSANAGASATPPVQLTVHEAAAAAVPAMATQTGGASSTSEPQSEVTSPRLRPCSPLLEAPPGALLADGADGATCEPRQPLEALSGEPNGALGFGQLDMLSRMATASREL